MKRFGHLFIMMVIFWGCMPQDPQTRMNPLVESDNQGAPNTDQTVDTSDNTELAWWFNQQTDKIITLNANSEDLTYIRGSLIDNFLNTNDNYQDVYCAVISYGLVGAVNQLRARALPIEITNFSSGQKERLYRVDLNDQSLNSAQCSGTIMSINSSIAFKPIDVCPGCQGIINAQSVQLFRVVSSANYAPIDLNTSSLVFRLDMQNNANTVGSCSDASCSALGFDCCVNGQCVNDLTQKPNTSIPAAIQNLVMVNPILKANFPQYFYICPNIANLPPDDTPVENPVDAANQAFANLVADYKCIKGVKDNALQNPFHLEFLSTENLNPDVDYEVPGIGCNETDASQPMYFRNVALRMYNACGCAIDSNANNPLDWAVNNCPNYYYLATSFNDNGEPTAISCYTPQPSNIPTPFQNLSVLVNNRQAPQRFFTKEPVTVFAGTVDERSFDYGDPIDDISPYFGLTNLKQEGPEFSYLDPVSKIYPLYEDPINNPFNFNGITGQLSLNLNQALPAKMIAVNAGDTYLVSTASGTYTPCPTCDVDYWFNYFTAHPQTQWGAGLRASGFTTRRDLYNNNLSNGNYEDTIFGRACWIPPTMVPFTHEEVADASPTNPERQVQRLNRLQVQAALYVNGYQRDWFGFNKGALIGSFDGVKWFAIGKSRIINASSDKLFLALNAPFADLASNNDHIVQVFQYDGISQGALFDYNPTLPINDPRQNEAGLCQKHHMCDTDADCVTQLGWEYMCAQVTSIKTFWPNFTQNADERMDHNTISAANAIPLQQILQQGSLPPFNGGLGSVNKRCVYRGAGSPCVQEINSITNSQLRRMLTCAPNFHCAQVNSNVFNSQLVRSAANLGDIPTKHYFGQDAKQLGRPLYYQPSAAQATPLSVSTQIEDALEKNLLVANNLMGLTPGLCRPGRSFNDVGQTIEDMHGQGNNNSEADYISQIGVADPAVTNALKYRYCPLFENNNYSFLNFLNQPASTLAANSALQNSSGRESLDMGGDSAFFEIENEQLNSVNNTAIVDMNFAGVGAACLRRAGAVCHTDLDCSPNRQHEFYALIKGIGFFGNAAEQKYWQESLICGQAETPPGINSPNYADFDMTKNRCCREQGKTLTIHSQDLRDENGNFIDDSDSLDTGILSYNAPDNPSRYSRFANVADFPSIDKPELGSLFADDGTGNLAMGTFDNPTMGTKNQWKTLSESASKTCCGGGYIRKFHNPNRKWGDANLFNFDISNFQCLNYMSPVPITDDPATDFGLNPANSAVHDIDRGYMCLNPGNYSNTPYGEPNSCMQVPMSQSNVGYGGGNYSGIPILHSSAQDASLATGDGNGLVTAGDVEGYAVFNSNPTPNSRNKWVPFFPRNLANVDNICPFLDRTGTTAGDSPSGCQDSTNNYNSSGAAQISLALPSYIPLGDFINADQRFSNTSPFWIYNSSNAKIITNRCQIEFTGMGGDCPNHGSPTFPLHGGGANNCSICYNQQNRHMGIAIPYNSCTNGQTCGIRFAFIAPGTEKANADLVDHTGAAINPPDGPAIATNPGSGQYYMKKLGKLELLGIPQVRQEPILCNSDPAKVIPNLYLDINGQVASNLVDVPILTAQPTTAAADLWSSNGTTPDFNNRVTLDPDHNGNYNLTSKDYINHEPIFSGHEFKCCKPLGKVEANDPSRCCSGYTTNIYQDGQQRCALKSGTDLSVYFNRFISNEGQGEELNPNDRLQDNDFDPYTGEPLLTNNVYTKLENIGANFCQVVGNQGNTVVPTRRGAAFGTFYGQPTPSTQYDNPGQLSTLFSIIDSFFDNNPLIGTSQWVGRDIFVIRGMRWNHHVYCSYEDGQ